MLAVREVSVAHAVLVDLVEKFCRADVHTSSPSESTTTSISEFNAPDYLFVSTIVAKAFPSLMESCIVQSYTTPLPGESAKQWRQSRWQRFLNHIQTPPHRGSNMNMFFRLSSIVLLTALTLLEYGATTPYLLQKMFVRFCQPFLVSAIILAFYMVIDSPLYIALFFLSVTMVVLYANRKRLSNYLHVREQHVVTPLLSSSSTSTSPPMPPVIMQGDDVHSNNNLVVLEEEDAFSISFSISSESLQLPSEGQSSSYPSPLNSSEEGSFYSSIPDSSIGNSDHSIVVVGGSGGRCCPSRGSVHVSDDNNNAYSSGESSGSSDEGGDGDGDFSIIISKDDDGDDDMRSSDHISIHISPSAYF